MADAELIAEGAAWREGGREAFRLRSAKGKSLRGEGLFKERKKEI